MTPWKCKGCLEEGDVVTYVIYGRGDIPSKIYTKVIISSSHWNPHIHTYSKYIKKGEGSTFAEAYDNSCSIYKAIGFNGYVGAIGTITWIWEWRPYKPRLIIETMDIKHRKYPNLKNPYAYPEDVDSIGKIEEYLFNKLYTKVESQELDNLTQVYIKTNSGYFYSQAVDESSKPFLRKLIEQEKVHTINNIDDSNFKMILDNGVPIIFDYKDMNVVVYPDIGIGEMRRVLINGINQYRLHHNSVDYGKWFDIDDSNDAFHKSIRYILSLDKPSPKSPPAILFKHFKGLYKGNTEQLLVEQHIPDEKRQYMWNIKMNPKYNSSSAKTFDTIVTHKHSDRNKVAEMFKVHTDDVVLMREVTADSQLLPELFEYDIIITVKNYYKVYYKPVASSHEELNYLVNMFAHEAIKAKEGIDTEFSINDVTYSILNLYQIDIRSKYPYDYYWFEVTSEPKIVDLVEKYYKEHQNREKFLPKSPFIARVQARNKGEAVSKLKERYPSLFVNKNNYRFIDQYKAIYHNSYIRKISVKLKHSGEIILSNNIPISYKEDPIYLGMEQLVYHNRVKKEPDIYEVGDYDIEIEYFWAPPHYKVESATVMPINKLKIKRHIPPKNFKGDRYKRRSDEGRHALRGKSSKNIVVVPMRKYEKDEMETIQVRHYIPQYSYEEVKIKFYKYETDIKGKRIKVGIDKDRSYTTIRRVFKGTKLVVEERTRPVRKRFKGIKNTKRR